MIAEDSAIAAFQIAEILAYQGDVERAFDWLERAREQQDGPVRAAWQSLLRHCMTIRVGRRCSQVSTCRLTRPADLLTLFHASRHGCRT
jgi:hypothetical protein